jgi:hypothetical protein
MDRGGGDDRAHLPIGPGKVHTGFRERLTTPEAVL